MSRLTVLLGKQIAFFRHRAGLTQEELAEKTDYSVDFIGLVERGINAPTVERLQNIANAVGVEVWELFRPLIGGENMAGNTRKKSKRKRR